MLKLTEDSQLNYLPVADVTITLYNRVQFVNATGKVMTRWQSTVIPNCFVGQKMATLQVGETKITDSSLLIQVPMFNEYLDSYEFKNKPSEDLEKHFTFNEEDLIVLMEVADEVDPELGVIEDIETKYGSKAFKISNISNNYGKDYPLPHIALS